MLAVLSEFNAVSVKRNKRPSRNAPVNETGLRNFAVPGVTPVRCTDQRDVPYWC